MKRSRRAETIFNNGRIVTRDEIIKGSLAICNGTITGLDSTLVDSSGTVDLQGDLLLPGLIEMHTDNLERNIQPRPGVLWPSVLAATLAHDIQIAGAGITTVFDAIAVGGLRADSFRNRLLAESLQSICAGKEQNLLRADHLVHLRCEVGYEHMETMLYTHGFNENVRLVSIMDHTPGQRQWSDLSKWRLYHRGKHWTEREAERILEDLLDKQTRFAEKHRRAAVAFARENNIVLASHDDTTPEDCLSAAEAGVVISEFPTTRSAAIAARQCGMSVVMGAPNAIRGQSHSGNISVRDLAGEGLLNGLSSDYVPASLLHSAFLLSDTLELPLPMSVAMVTANIADMVGLNDRGEIALGKRADLIQVTVVNNLPVVRRVWRQGFQIV